MSMSQKLIAILIFLVGFSQNIMAQPRIDKRIDGGSILIPGGFVDLSSTISVGGAASAAIQPVIRGGGFSNDDARLCYSVSPDCVCDGKSKVVVAFRSPWVWYPQSNPSHKVSLRIQNCGVEELNIRVGTRVFTRADDLAGNCFSNRDGCTVTEDSAPIGLRLETGFAITEGVSGAWYDPKTSGQGLFVHVLPERKVIAYWFTFDSAGQQAWFGGVGDIEKNRVSINALQTTGGKFPPLFNSSSVVNQPWGRFDIEFTGCNDGVIRFFPIRAGFGAGELPLKRLTSIAGNRCSEYVDENLQAEYIWETDQHSLLQLGEAVDLKVRVKDSSGAEISTGSVVFSADSEQIAITPTGPRSARVLVTGNTSGDKIQIKAQHRSYQNSSSAFLYRAPLTSAARYIRSHDVISATSNSITVRGDRYAGIQPGHVVFTGDLYNVLLRVNSVTGNSAGRVISGSQAKLDDAFTDFPEIDLGSYNIAIDNNQVQSSIQGSNQKSFGPNCSLSPAAVANLLSAKMRYNYKPSVKISVRPVFLNERFSHLSVFAKAAGGYYFSIEAMTSAEIGIGIDCEIMFATFRTPARIWFIGGLEIDAGVFVSARSRSSGAAVAGYSSWGNTENIATAEIGGRNNFWAQSISSGGDDYFFKTDVKHDGSVTGGFRLRPVISSLIGRADLIKIDFALEKSIEISPPGNPEVLQYSGPKYGDRRFLSVGAGRDVIALNRLLGRVFRDNLFVPTADFSLTLSRSDGGPGSLVATPAQVNPNQNVNISFQSSPARQGYISFIAFKDGQVIWRSPETSGSQSSASFKPSQFNIDQGQISFQARMVDIDDDGRRDNLSSIFPYAASATRVVTVGSQSPEPVCRPFSDGPNIPALLPGQNFRGVISVTTDFDSRRRMRSTSATVTVSAQNLQNESHNYTFGSCRFGLPEGTISPGLAGWSMSPVPDFAFDAGGPNQQKTFMVRVNPAAALPNLIQPFASVYLRCEIKASGNNPSSACAQILFTYCQNCQ